MDACLLLLNTLNTNCIQTNSMSLNQHTAFVVLVVFLDSISKSNISIKLDTLRSNQISIREFTEVPSKNPQTKTSLKAELTPSRASLCCQITQSHYCPSISRQTPMSKRWPIIRLLSPRQALKSK